MLGCNTEDYKMDCSFTFTLYFDVLNVDLFFYFTDLFLCSESHLKNALAEISFPTNECVHLRRQLVLSS